jgi:hypothetical protein
MSVAFVFLLREFYGIAVTQHCCLYFSNLFSAHYNLILTLSIYGGRVWKTRICTMKPAKMTFNMESLEVIRQKIINAINSVNLTLNKEYKLSKSASHKGYFMVEIVNPDDSSNADRIKRIKKILVRDFERKLVLKDNKAFITIDFIKVYEQMK